MTATDAAEMDAGMLPLMLLPGTLCDERVFAPLLDRLPHARAMVADMHGLSSTHALATRILAQAPTRFALLGFSLGALVALEMAAFAPDRVAGLALVGGNGHGVAPVDRDARRQVAAQVASVTRHVGETLWHASVADPGDEALRTLVMAMAEACPTGALPVQVEVAVTRRDSLPHLASLAMPTLVLAGAADAINPPSSQQALARGIADAELVLVPDAGHFVLLEQPDACADVVRAWLAAVQAGTPAPVATTLAKEAV